MNLLRQYTATLTNQELWGIASSFEVYEREGVIGNEPIRTHTEKFLETNSLPKTMVTIWMTSLALETFRQLAYRFNPQ